MQEPNDRSHRVRRTVIDECGVISTACRLEAGGLRSMYPRASTEGSPFLIPATVCLAETNTPSGSSSSGASWKRRSRLDGASDGTSKRTSKPRPRIGGMLEDADLDGMLRLGGPSGSPNSSKRWEIQPVRPCRGARHLAERSVKAALGRTPRGGYAECVPRPRRDLTTTEKRHLHSLEGRIERLEAELHATRREWAELVEEAGQAAVARELGVSRQAVADRLRRIRANREGRSGRR